jgi:hypothetical protein
LKNSTSIIPALDECSTSSDRSVRGLSFGSRRTQAYPVHLGASPFENFSRFGGSVYDRHCPAGASVVTPAPDVGARQMKRCLISTRSVQHPSRAEGVTSSSMLGSQSLSVRSAARDCAALHPSSAQTFVVTQRQNAQVPVSPVSQTSALLCCGKRFSSAKPSLCSLCRACARSRGGSLLGPNHRDA